MNEYHKINGLYKRDNKGFCIKDELSCPEFSYLYHEPWLWTEKVDGTNIRLHFSADGFRIGGRTDNAQIPSFLLDRLQTIAENAPELDGEITLYGEGYGAKIQKGGGNYKSDGVDFVLFDVYCGGYWLQREDVEKVAESFGIAVVPIVEANCTIEDMEEAVACGIPSTWGDFEAEGVVGVPKVQLFDRYGKRIITKLKTKDYERGWSEAAA